MLTRRNTNSKISLSRLWGRAGVGVFLLFPFTLFAQSTPAQDEITSVLQQISLNNLELQALQKENAAIVSDLKAENLPSGPTVEYSPFYTRGYHGMASSELVVSQEFDFPTRYAERRRQTALESAALDAEHCALRSDILLRARLLCLDIVAQNLSIDLLLKRSQQAETTTALLQARKEAGDATALDLNKARLEQMEAAQQLAEAESTRSALLAQLCQMNGGKAITLTQRTFPPAPTLPRNAGEDSQSQDLNSLCSTKWNTSSDTNSQTPSPTLWGRAGVGAAQSRLAAAQHEEQMVRRNWLPSLSVGYRRNTEEHSRLNGFLVGASFPLWSFSAQRKAARQRTESAELRLRETRQAVQNEQQALQDQLQHLQQVLTHTDTQLLTETLSLLDLALQHGQITALEFYTESDDIYTKLLNRIALHCQYAKLHAELYRPE